MHRKLFFFVLAPLSAALCLAMVAPVHAGDGCKAQGDTAAGSVANGNVESTCSPVSIAAASTATGSGGLDEAEVQAIADAGDAATLDAAKAYASGQDQQVIAAVNKVREIAQDYADEGDVATLAASKTYTDTKSTQALAASKAYTDSKFAAWNDSFTQMQQQLDRRFATTDRRIDRIGAMGTAMTQMAVNAAIGNSAAGRVAIGIGGQGSQGALSVGYGKRIGDRASFSFGASYSGGESSAGAGFGFDL